jgi:hypothetical protein
LPKRGRVSGTSLRVKSCLLSPALSERDEPWPRTSLRCGSLHTGRAGNILQVRSASSRAPRAQPAQYTLPVLLLLQRPRAAAVVLASPPPSQRCIGSVGSRSDRRGSVQRLRTLLSHTHDGQGREGGCPPAVHAARAAAYRARVRCCKPGTGCSSGSPRQGKTLPTTPHPDPHRRGNARLVSPSARCILTSPLARCVSALQSLIEKVTENNESPAPGWALDQMARLTIQKPGIEIEMVDLLFKRLQKNSCDVKLKCLRAMHFIARRGSVAFRRAMQRGSQVIRAHLSKLPRSAPTDPTPFSAHLGFTQLSPPPLARPLPVRFSRSVPADSRVLALLRSHPGQPAPGAR